MTFISEALYNSLKKEQEALLGQIGDLTKESTDLANRIKNDEAFLASYDSTTTKLQASIANAESQIPVLEKRIDDNKTLEAQSKADLEKQNEDLKKLKEDLKVAIDKKEPQSVIDSINASIVVVESRISDLQKVIDWFHENKFMITVSCIAVFVSIVFLLNLLLRFVPKKKENKIISNGVRTAD